MLQQSWQSSHFSILNCDTGGMRTSTCVVCSKTFEDWKLDACLSSCGYFSCPMFPRNLCNVTVQSQNRKHVNKQDQKRCQFLGNLRAVGRFHINTFSRYWGNIKKSFDITDIFPRGHQYQRKKVADPKKLNKPLLLQMCQKVCADSTYCQTQVVFQKDIKKQKQKIKRKRYLSEAVPGSQSAFKKKTEKFEKKCL